MYSYEIKVKISHMNIFKKIDANNQSLFSKINFDSSYYYWCDKLELQKLVSFEGKDKYRFIYASIDYKDTESQHMDSILIIQKK